MERFLVFHPNIGGVLTQNIAPEYYKVSVSLLLNRLPQEEKGNSVNLFFKRDVLMLQVH